MPSTTSYARIFRGTDRHSTTYNTRSSGENARPFGAMISLSITAAWPLTGSQRYRFSGSSCSAHSPS